MSLRDSILAAALLRTKQTAIALIPVMIQELSVKERAEFVALVNAGAAVSAWLVARKVRDPQTSEAIFSDDDVAHIEASSPGVIEAVAREILVLSGLAKENGEPAEDAGKS